MILKVKIKNFQSHKNTEIQFDPSVTIVTGDSNAGKTSVMRAINWVKGDIRGDSFTKDRNETVEVVIETTDCTITKTRDKYTTLYTLIKDGEQQIFETANCPQEIFEALNLDEINIQNQHSPIFLVGNSSVERAAFLSKLFNYDDNVVEDMLTFEIQDLNSNSSELKTLKKLLEKEEEDLTKIQSLRDSLSDLVQTLKQTLQLYEDGTKKFSLYNISITDIEKKLELINIIDPQIKDLKTLKELYGKLENLILRQMEKLSLIQNGKSNMSKLNSYSDKISEINSRIEKGSKLEKLYKKLVTVLKKEAEIKTIRDRVSYVLTNIEKNNNSVNTIHILIDKLKAINEYYKQIIHIKSSFIMWEDLQTQLKKLESVENETKKLNEQRQSIFNELVESNIVCPTCNKELTNEDIKHVLC